MNRDPVPPVVLESLACWEDCAASAYESFKPVMSTAEVEQHQPAYVENQNRNSPLRVDVIFEHLAAQGISPVARFRDVPDRLLGPTHLPDA